MTRSKFLTIFILLICFHGIKAQADKDASLFMEIKKQDSIFFERGFNRCDLQYIEKHIVENLKFFHDQSGFQDKNAFFENIKRYICSDPEIKPIRKIKEGDFSVFPLHSNGSLYGAIQSGIHHFYLREAGKEDIWTSTAKFTHVWILENGLWKLSEVLSYDHQAPIPENQQTNEIAQLLKENKVPALGLGVIEHGKLTKIAVYGTLDTKTTAPYNTIFKVASLTKPIVALTTLKLIDKGLLGLEEPLYPYWIDPDIKKDEKYKKLTPKLVLTHQTGFPNWRYMTEANRLSFQFDPGTKHQYSGEGFEYLRKAIENKLGRSIEELANELVFQPSGMTDTSFWWDSTMDETRYAQNFDSKGNTIPLKKHYEANAAANLLTTVEDYGRFLQYVVNGAGLSEMLFEEMNKHHVTLRENDFFGLGWEILTGFSTGDHALLHTGKDPGVSTLAIVFPKSKNGYLIFLNGDNADKVYEELLTKHFFLGDELWNKR